MRCVQSAFGIVLVCLIATLAGCGGGGEGAAERVPVYEVSGKITMGGGPLANATVGFSPQGDQPAATGRTNDAGEYQLSTYDGFDGAAVGSYRVIVKKIASANESSGEEHEGVEVIGEGHGSSAASDSGNLVPESYGSVDDTPLSAEVTEDGENRFDFEIE